MRALIPITVLALVGCIGCKPPPAGTGGAAQAHVSEAELAAALDWIGEDVVAAMIIHPQRLSQSPLWGKESPDLLLKEMTPFDDQELVQYVRLNPGAGAKRLYMATQIIRFVNPIDGPRWMAAEFSMTERKTHDRGDYYLRPERDRPQAGWQVDERTVIVAMEEQLLKLMTAKPKGSPLAEKLRANGLNKDFIVAFVPDDATRTTTREYLAKVKQIPSQRRIIPDGLVAKATSLTDGLTSVVLTIDTAREPFVHCVAETKDPASAKDLEALAVGMRPQVLAIFRQQPDQFVPKSMQWINTRVEQVLNGLQFTPKGKQLVATASMPKGLPDDVTRALAAAREMIPVNRLKSIGVCMHVHHDVFKELPPSKSVTEIWRPDGKPNLSWRVALLPYLEQNKLFEQFHLDEPWDSPHNLKLLDQMPEFFKTGSDPQKTSIVAVCGADAIFDENGKGSQFNTIKDGLTNTILLVQAGPDKAVPWTKPEDVPFVPGNPVSAFGQVGETFLVVMADGQVMRLPATIPPEKLAALITASGGEQVKASDFAKK